MRRLFVILCWCASSCAAKATDPAAVDDTAAVVDTSDNASIDGASGGDIGANITCGENWAQGYCVKFTFHGQKFDGRTFDRPGIQQVDEDVRQRGATVLRELRQGC